MTKGPLPPSGTDSRHRQKAIGRELARQYAQVLAEPVPEHFLLLLESVERKSPGAREAQGREAQ
jgi:hypothetical protein